MEILETVDIAKDRLRTIRNKGLGLGFVPTMGAIHEGHLSLVRRAAEENDRTAVSIFVNPTQFDNPEDLEQYPRDLEGDRGLLAEAGADFLFYPDADAMYPDAYRYKVIETEKSRILEGAHRPGHFDGVLTVVLKLLNLVAADRAYFGEKDWQQFTLVQEMAEAFFLDTKIIPCSTVRENDGLALSSRNSLLNNRERLLAPKLHRILSGKKSPEEKAAALRKEGFDVDYVERWNGRLLAAAGLGKVRLIDNVPE